MQLDTHNTLSLPSIQKKISQFIFILINLRIKISVYSVLAKQSPCHATFGKKPICGLHSLPLFMTLLKNLTTEAKLLATFCKNVIVEYMKIAMEWLLPPMKMSQKIKNI